jgi:hypothetical protein
VAGVILKRPEGTAHVNDTRAASRSRRQRQAAGLQPCP